MVALNTPVCEFGKKAIEFNLKDCKDNGFYNLDKCNGSNGLLVMFICNHCPYVKSIITDLVAAVNRLEKSGINTVAIMSNDWLSYPEDTPENMVNFKNNNKFNFPYLIDETQEVAKLYDAVCTPDFFGFNRNLELQYRGRFDARGREGRGNISSSNSELEQAMELIARTQKGPENQNPSIGCSIKWCNEDS